MKRAMFIIPCLAGTTLLGACGRGAPEGEAGAPTEISRALSTSGNLVPMGYMHAYGGTGTTVGLDIRVTNAGPNRVSGTNGTVKIDTTVLTGASIQQNQFGTGSNSLDPGKVGYIHVEAPPSLVPPCSIHTVVIDQARSLQTGNATFYQDDSRATITTCPLTWATTPVNVTTLGEAPDQYILNKTLKEIVSSFKSAREDSLLCSSCHFQGAQETAGPQPYQAPVPSGAPFAIDPDTLVFGSKWRGDTSSWSYRFMIANYPHTASLRIAFQKWRDDGQLSEAPASPGQRIINDVMSIPGWTSIVPMNLNDDFLTDLLAYNATSGRVMYSVSLGGGAQRAIADFTASPGWTAIIPMRLNDDNLTDLLSYNKDTGRAVYSFGTSSGVQGVVNDVMSIPGWTSIVPMNLNNDGFTDLLAYNATSGRVMYSFSAGGGSQRVLADFTASAGWTSIVPLDLNFDGLTDLLSYNATTGQAVYSISAGGATQQTVATVAASPGWSLIVPLRDNLDSLTDLLSYSVASGRAVTSIGVDGFQQKIVSDISASQGWTAIVPMNLENDGFTDLLSYNAATGRAVYSLAIPAP